MRVPGQPVLALPQRARYRGSFDPEDLPDLQVGKVGVRPRNLAYMLLVREGELLPTTHAVGGLWLLSAVRRAWRVGGGAGYRLIEGRGAIARIRV